MILLEIFEKCVIGGLLGCAIGYGMRRAYIEFRPGRGRR